MRSENTSCSDEVDGVATTVDQLRHALGEANASLDDLRAELALSRAELGEQLMRVREMSEELASLKAGGIPASPSQDPSVAQVGHESALSAAAALREEVARAQSENADLAGGMRELQSWKDEAARQIARLQEELALATSQRDEQVVVLNAEKQKAEALAIRLDALSSELNSARRDLDEVRRLHQDRVNQVRKLDAQRDELKRRLEHALTRHEHWLSYQLGMAMINAGKSFSGFLTLPLVLIRIGRQHRRQGPAGSISPDGSSARAAGNGRRDADRGVLRRGSGGHKEVIAHGSMAGTIDAPALERRQGGCRFDQVLPFDGPDRHGVRRLRVASILDAFSDACFAPECDLLRIKPADWRDQLECRQIDMLLVESAWSGNDGQWQYRVGKYGAPPGNELSEVVAWCKSKGIPTVFWNKEDPPNFERFVDRAAEFDHIFTTDSDCIPKYRSRCPSVRTIAALPFAAQPAIHHPVQREGRQRRIFFAGTYYADDFLERRNGMDALLRAAQGFGLDIYDRMHNADPSAKTRYLFPEDLRPNIVGQLRYEDLLHAYRQYRIGLNVNSVTDSPTMFSRRVFELLACGTPVVSTYSRGIVDCFADLVPMADNQEDAEREIRTLMETEDHWLKVSAKGLRVVHESHSYAHRLKTICETIGLDPASFLSVDIPMVVVVRASGNASLFARRLRQQHLQPVAVIVPGVEERDPEVAAHVIALREAGYEPRSLPEANLASFLRQKYPDAALAFCESRCYYGPSYLRDAAYTARYAKGALASGIRTHFRLEGAGVVPDLDIAEQYGRVITDFHPASLVMSVRTFYENYSTRAHVPCIHAFNRYGFDFFPDENLTEDQAGYLCLGK